MAYGREWAGRIEYKKGGEKRMAWSYQGTPSAAQQKLRHTLAPRAQLILSIDPSAIREEVLAAATSVAAEVCLSVCLPVCFQVALLIVSHHLYQGSSDTHGCVRRRLCALQEQLARARSAKTQAEMAPADEDDEAAEAAAASAAVAMAESEEDDDEDSEAARRRQLAAALASGDDAAGGSAASGDGGAGTPKWFRGAGR